MCGYRGLAEALRRGHPAVMPFNVMELAQAERADFAELLEGLTPEQWEAPSLCERWRVRDVAAHVLSYEELGTLPLARRFARGRFTINRTNAVGVAEFAEQSPEQLLELARRSMTPRGLSSMFGGRIALADGMVHQQDIRRALGIPRSIPPERLKIALDFARFAPAIGLPAAGRVRGLKLVATDMDWSAGRGPEVRGPAEALLMAVAGRHGITDELSGDGQPTLAKRISRS
jgi:uncharacterized protein (TIGR03083 family)